MYKIVGFVAFVVLSTVVVVGGYLARDQAIKVENAQRTPAVILSKHLHSHVSRDSDGRSTTMYLPEITYRCDFDGGSVVSSEVYPVAVSRGGTTGRQWARSILDQYKEGQTVQAWYNPNDVNQTFLIRQITFFPYIFILVAALIAALLITFFGRGADERRNQKMAMFGTMLMGVFAAAVLYHYFSIAGPDSDGIVKPVMAGYFVLMTIPFAISLPNGGFAERLKSGLIVGGALGFAGIWLGIFGGGIIGLISEFCRSMKWIDQSFGGPHWAMYTIPAMAIPGFLFGLVADKEDPTATKDDPVEEKNDDWVEGNQHDEDERTL